VKESAFPASYPGLDGGTVTHYGLTKREYYAAKAMQGLSTLAFSHVIVSPEWVAKASVDHADALIKALEDTNV